MANMEDIVQYVFKQAKRQKKPQEHIHWKPDDPGPQPFSFWDMDAGIWQPISPRARRANNDQAQQSPDPIMAPHSWNIDFMLPFAEAQMTAALARSARSHRSCSPPRPRQSSST